MQLLPQMHSHPLSLKIGEGHRRVVNTPKILFYTREAFFKESRQLCTGQVRRDKKTG